MKNKLVHITDEEFSKAVALSRQHPELVPLHHMLQKLTILDFVIPLLGPKNDHTILEIGAGLGIHSALLSHYGRVSCTELQSPGSFIGADDKVAEKRERVFALLGNGQIDFKYHDGTRLPYESRSFDVVFHNSVIEHVSDIDAFNRETLRVLKPGGLCICITGTPALCKFRLVKHYAFRFPIQLAVLTARECLSPVKSWLPAALSSRLSRVDQKLDRLHPATATEPATAPAGLDVSRLHARLHHYIHFPDYNRVVFAKAAADSGVSESELLQKLRHHFKSAANRIAFGINPITHGQHYHDVWHEMQEWRLDRWKDYFQSAGFSIEKMIGYRYHHVLEATPSPYMNALLYFRSAKRIHRQIQRGSNPAHASEIIIVARPAAQPV